MLLFFHLWAPFANRFQFFDGMIAPQPLLSSDEPWYWLYLSNWRDWNAGGGFASQWLGHFWSLAVEEQFYLFWPLAIYLVSRRRLPGLFIGVFCASLLLSVAAEFGGAQSETLHRLTVFRLDTLALGAMVALVVRNPLWNERVSAQLKLIFPASTAAALLSLAAYQQHIAHVPSVSLTYLFAAISFSSAVFFCINNAGSASKFCRFARMPWLRTCGKYSYAMYIFHGPIYHGVQVLFIYLGTHNQLPTGITQATFLWSETAIAFFATYFVGFACWHGLEKHLLTFKSHFGYTFALAEGSPITHTTPGHQSAN